MNELTKRYLFKLFLTTIFYAVAVSCGGDGGRDSSPTTPTAPTAPIAPFAPVDQAAFDSFAAGKNMVAEFVSGPQPPAMPPPPTTPKYWGPFPLERTYEFKDGGVTAGDGMTTAAYSYLYENRGPNTGALTIDLGNDPGQDPFVIAFELSFTSATAGTFESTFANGFTGETSSLTGNFEFFEA